MDNGENARILVVDDVPDTLNLLTTWLETQGYDTLRASNGNQAIQQAVEHLPDLILLDVMMPQMDGIETCRQLKTRPQTATIPVILVTAKDPSDARAEGMIAGATDYITKPVNLHDLIIRVDAALAKQRESLPVDVQRLIEEISHTAMTMLDSALVWLLVLDDNRLISEMLTTTSGARDEEAFLSTISGDDSLPLYSLDMKDNPLIDTLITRRIATNLPVQRLQQSATTEPLYQACQRLHIGYLTIVPLIAAGKTVGVMAMGYHQPHDMETPRAHQALSSFGSQAATALDYARLITNLRQREEEADNERAFRQMILDTMSDGLIVIDAQGYIKFTNRRLLRMTGYPAGYLEGRIVGELFHPEDRDEVMRGLLSENAATMKFDQRLMTVENAIIDVLLSRSRTRSASLDNQVIILSDMTEQKKREYDLERQTGHLTALNKATQVMTSNLSLYEVLQDILNSACNVVEGQGASLFLVNKDNMDELFVVAAVGYHADDLIGLRVPIGEGLAGWVAREGQSQLVTDPRNDPRFYKQIDDQTGLSTRSLIAVPLVHADQMIGVIEVVNKLGESVFDGDDVRLLESMAGTAAVSIMNARLYDQAQRRVSELATLLDASEAASSTLELANALEHIMHSLIHNLDVAQAVIMVHHGKQLISLAEALDAHWPDLDGPLFVVQPGTAMYTALITGQPAIASSQERNLHASHRFYLDTTGTTSMLCVPIEQGDAVVGAVTCATNSRTTFSDQAIAKVRTLVSKWSSTHLTGRPLAGQSIADLTELGSALLEQIAPCRIAIHAWSPGNSSTRLVRKMGFIEWTRRTGPELSVDDFPALNQVLQSSQASAIERSSLDEDTSEHQWLTRWGGNSALLVPLLLHAVPIGLVALIDHHERLFDDEETNLAQGIANIVSNAIENARLYQSLQSRAKALESAYGELQEADRAKDQFIQNVSHELRTPLIHVMGYAELLADGAFGLATDEQRDALGSIVKKGQQIANIVEDMVAVQSQEERTFDLQPINIVPVIQRALSQRQAQIQELGLRLLTHFPNQVPLVMADEGAIMDVFDKLLDNALKFGVEGGRIEIGITDTEGPMVQIAIRDYGIGIDRSEHTNIFQRFYQVDGSATRHYGGTGLGLAVAKAIMEGHGGKISLTSKSGEGSIFFFSLPKQDLNHKKSTGYLTEQPSHDPE